MRAGELPVGKVSSHPPDSLVKFSNETSVLVGGGIRYEQRKVVFMIEVFECISKQKRRN